LARGLPFPSRPLKLRRPVTPQLGFFFRGFPSILGFSCQAGVLFFFPIPGTRRWFFSEVSRYLRQVSCYLRLLSFCQSVLSVPSRFFLGFPQAWPPFCFFFFLTSLFVNRRPAAPVGRPFFPLPFRFPSAIVTFPVFNLICFPLLWTVFVGPPPDTLLPLTSIPCPRPAFL